jgi:hypothetical protein
MMSTMVLSGHWNGMHAGGALQSRTDNPEAQRGPDDPRNHDATVTPHWQVANGAMLPLSGT